MTFAIQFARENPTDPKTKNTLGRAYRTLRRTGELVDGLMLLAQLVRSPDAAAHSDVGVVLEDVVEELQPLARENQVELKLGPLVSSEVACGSGVLANMVSNLVGNSIKYMGDSAVRSVTVSADASADDVRVEVRDTGPGIPEEARGTIFDLYARAAPRGISGLGLGLATVHRLADVLGGRVGFESRAGAGTSFWIALPKAWAHGKRTARPAQPTRIVRLLGRRTG